MRWLGPDEAEEKIGPGTAKTSRPCSRAKRAVIRAPERSRASTTTTPFERPEIIRFRRGKFFFLAGGPGGFSESTSPPSFFIRSARGTFFPGEIESRLI